MCDNKGRQEIQCQSGYYKCGERRSLHSFVSAALFIVAIVGLIWAYLNGSLPVPGDRIEDPELSGQFANIYLYIFILPFVLHWTRIYFSFIKIDEEPDFYRVVLRHLKNKNKYFEWFLRVLMLFTLVWFVQSMRARNGEIAQTVFFKFRFFPILCLYSLLCLWDAFLFIYVPITLNSRHPWASYKQLKDEDKERIKWVVNDTLGLLMASTMILVEAQIVTKANMLYCSTAISVMGAAALGLLIWDFVINLKEYRKCVSRSLFPNYGQIKCSDICPLELD